MYLSLSTYTNIQLEDLSYKASAAGKAYQEYENGMLSRDSLFRIVESIVEGQVRANCIITDEKGNTIIENIHYQSLQDNNIEKVNEEISMALMDIPVERSPVLLANGESALSFCSPIKDESNSIIGCVFLLRPYSEVQSFHTRLNRALFRAVLLCLPILLILSTLGVRKFTLPIYKMAESAIKMRNGDFEARADESAAGELGLLARALNELCSSLSHTIRQLESEKSQLKEILSSFSEGVAATDNLGCLTHYNKSLMEIFGNVGVKTRLDLIPDVGIWEAFDEVYNTGEGASMRYPLPGERMLWITINPVVTENNERVGVVGLFKDMTAVEKLERTRREYVANVSHEMRTPLTAMRGLLEPLSDGLVNNEEDRQRYYKIMLREVLRLSRLITDMLQLSRLQSGTEYMEFTKVDMEEVLTDVVKGYSAEAATREVNLKLEMGKLPNALTDPDRVEQVLIILLDNALRFTKEGGEIAIRAEVRDKIYISVSDTGIGIPEDDIPHIFDRFYTVDKSRKEGGTGLGLSIARHIMMKLGEDISVESEVDKGTVFTFTLKKYVLNAIALGPPLEDEETDAESLPPLFAPRKKEELIDAVYEILPQKEKIKTERRRNKEKSR